MSAPPRIRGLRSDIAPCPKSAKSGRDADKNIGSLIPHCSQDKLWPRVTPYLPLDTGKAGHVALTLRSLIGSGSYLRSPCSTVMPSNR